MALFERSFFSQLHGLRIVSRRLAQGRLFGEARGLRTGRAGEFADHRRYVPGDDFRSIDWPAYGRLRKPFVKLSESREERPVTLALDASASMRFGQPPRWDYARRLAAALAFVALDSRERVTILRFAERPEALMPSLHGSGKFRELCGRLESASLSGRGSVSNCLAFLPAFCPGRGLIIVISDFLDSREAGRALSTLAGTRHEIILLHLFTPWEAMPELPGDWELEDMETGETVPVDGGDTAMAAYRGRFRALSEKLRSLALRRGMHYVMASTGVPEATRVRGLLNSL
ncbi:MAG: DUF58 domain-containing protein [Planctomycetes bacterium]|nr:DUF58 domain-containing protein [Planctomycetota bacterium]